MEKFITSFRHISSVARQTDSRGVRLFNRIAVFKCVLLTVVLLSGIGVAQAQQPDPLTITPDGKVGIGNPAPANKLSVTGNADVSGNLGVGTTAPVNKLSVAGNADFSGTVGIGTNTLGTSRFRIANPSSSTDFAHFRFDAAAGAGEFEFVGWANGWNINSKTSGKNLYLNRDANSTSDVLIGRSGNEMIVKGETGRVGIGTTNPLGRLQLVASSVTDSNIFAWDSRFLVVGADANAGGISLSYNQTTNTGYLFSLSPSVAWRNTVIQPFGGGNVGIGTENPTKAKLEINGAVGTHVGHYGYLGPTGAGGNYAANTTLNYSVWASNNIGAMEFHSFSDARIKNIQGRSDSATDLRTLLGIEVTDYRYKDVIGHGNGAYKKVTGQQVEKVFPQAVSKHTEVVPDIYRQASIENGWVALATDLKRGERVKLITAKGDEGMFEVLEVAQGRFRTDFKPEGDRVFVYGREVKDFLTVDYGAISMLNVSATQQIKKEKDAEVKALQEENAALRSQLVEQEKRLASIEALLLSPNQPTVSAASLHTIKQSKQ